MSLEFCARCGASTGRAHAYHKADGTVVCHDCQHRENLDRIEARRHLRPVASIAAVAVILVVGGGFVAWRHLAEKDRDAAASGMTPDAGSELTLSERVAQDVIARQQENPELADDPAIRAAIAAFRESGHVSADFDEKLLHAGVVEALRRLR